MKLLFLFLLLSLLSCGPDQRDREDYGDITQGPGGITLVSSVEHRGGYGRSECLLCHNAQYNLHRRPGSGLDADTLNQLILEQGGSAYCLTCHGNNGTGN